MSEHVRKIIPYEPFEIDAIEGWLDRLAQQGLMLESITLRFAKFKKSEPATVRHRVDINTYQKEQLTDELHAYYEECGWRHIATFSCGKFSVYRAQNNAATELHTDLAVLNQALRRTAIGQLILAIVFYGYAAWISVGMYRYFISGGVMQSLLHDGVKLLCCAALAIILALTCGTVNVLAFIRLRRRQKSGAILAHKGYAQVRANVKVGIVIAITVIAAFTLVMLASGFDHYEEHPLTEYTHALAFPLWEDIAPDEWDAVQSCRTDTNFHEFSNYIMIRHSYFAPNILMTRQEGIRAEV
jgi:hypothetical protein